MKKLGTTRTAITGLALAIGGICSTASAAPFSFSASTDAAALASATLAAGSGISIVAGSQTYQGGATQGGTYSNFSFSNSTTTVAIGNGVVMTSGDINHLPGNDSSSMSANPGAGTDADLDSLSAQTVTNDANVLTFDFTVDAGITSLALDFVFGTDEYPDQGVTDIFGVFVDGVNYAKYSDGSLVNFTVGSPGVSFFVNNNFGSLDPLKDEAGTGLEYDGVVNKLMIIGILDELLTTHTIKIAIGDTSDTIYDSGVFVANLTGGTIKGDGGIDTGGNTPVPAPATIPLMLTALGALGFLRRRKKIEVTS